MNLREIYIAIAAVAIPVLLGYAAFSITLGIRWWKGVPHKDKPKEVLILVIVITAFCLVSFLMGHETKVTVMVGALALLVALFIRSKPIDLSFLGDRK